MSGLVEIMLSAEAALERRLCGLAICRPKTMAESAVRPEIDLGAKAFYDKFEKAIPEILAATEDDAITLAVYCCASYRDFFRFYAAIQDIDTFHTAPNFGAELIAARTARKALRYLEEHPDILKAGEYDG